MGKKKRARAKRCYRINITDCKHQSTMITFKTFIKSQTFEDTEVSYTKVTVFFLIEPYPGVLFFAIGQFLVLSVPVLMNCS